MGIRVHPELLAASAMYVSREGTLEVESSQMKVGMSATDAAFAASAESLICGTAAWTSAA